MNETGTVWGDVLFLVDFSMDFLCFFIAASLRGRKFRPGRAAAGAALGGLWSVAELILDGYADGIGGRLLLLACRAAVLFVMCAVAEAGPGIGFADVLRACGCFFAVASLLGGAMTALYSLFNRWQPPDAARTAPDGLSAWLFALLAAAGGAVTWLSGRRHRRNPPTAAVTLRRDGREVTLTALCDTGNLLADPLSGRGVMLCELDAVAPLFPAALGAFWQAGGKLPAVCGLPPALAAGLRYVPARSATGEETLLCAAAVDSVTLTAPGGGKPQTADLLIAPVARRVGEGEIRAILPASILKQ